MTVTNLFQETSRQIRSFAKLPHGWHYGTGVGATPEAVETATEVNSIFFLYGAEETEVFPDVDGGILVSSYYDDNTVEALCLPYGAIEVTVETGDDITDEKTNLSLQDFENYMKELSWNPVRSSACYTHNTSAERKNVLQVLHFESQEEKMAYRYSISNVLADKAEPYATISEHITEPSQDIRLSSGRLTHVPSQKNVGLPTKFQKLGIPVTVTSEGWTTAGVGT